jgi:hypothetical protein
VTKSPRIAAYRRISGRCAAQRKGPGARYWRGTPAPPRDLATCLRRQKSKVRILPGVLSSTPLVVPKAPVIARAPGPGGGLEIGSAAITANWGALDKRPPTVVLAVVAPHGVRIDRQRQLRVGGPSAEPRSNSPASTKKGAVTGLLLCMESSSDRERPTLQP